MLSLRVIQKVQPLHLHNLPTRVKFCRWFSNDPTCLYSNRLSKILHFTDEAMLATHEEATVSLPSLIWSEIPLGSEGFSPLLIFDLKQASPSQKYEPNYISLNASNNVSSIAKIRSLLYLVLPILR